MSKRSAKSRQKTTNRAKSAFRKWEKERYPIYDKDGIPLIQHEGDIFVPIWDYSHRKQDSEGFYYVKTQNSKSRIKVKYDYTLQKGESYVVDPKIDKTRYVSLHGEIISFRFHGTDKPLLMTKTVSTRGYLLVGESLRVHKLVWFSFMADAIQRRKINPNEELPYDLPLSYGVEIKTLSDLKKLSDHEVHHRDSDVTNNVLWNLELLPNDVHDTLTDMRKYEDKWNRFVRSNAKQYYTDKSSIFIANDDDVVALALDQAELDKNLSSKVKKELNNSYWTYISQNAFNQVLEQVGSDFFDCTRYMCIEVNGMHSFFKFEREEAGLMVFKIEAPEDIDIDILCKNDKIYLPKDIAV